MLKSVCQIGTILSMITNPKVTIDLINKNLQNRITWTSSPNQSFGDLSLLNVPNKISPDFSTFELNETILDDTIGYEIKNIAFMSTSISSDSCSFGTVWVKGEFDTEVDFYDAAINFGINYPKSVQISYEDDNGAIIGSDEFDNIDGSILHIRRAQTGVKRIVLEFLDSYAPYQYAHLQEFIIGDNIVFDKDTITELRLNETTNSISNSLEIGTASLEVYGKPGTNNIFDSSNIQSFIKKNQKMRFEVEIIKDNVSQNIFLGYYYCNKITLYENGKIQIDCYTLLGIMDKITYGASPFSENNTTGADFINTIFTVLANRIGGTASSFYEIDYTATEIVNQNIPYGYIPVMSCREALHHICFVLGLCVLDNRNEKILIKKIRNYYISTVQIIPDDIISNVEFENIEEVNSLKVDMNKFVKSDSEELVATINDSDMFVFNSPIDINTLAYNPNTGFVPKISSTAIILEYNSQPFEVQVYAKQYTVQREQSIEFRILDPNNYGKQLTLMDSKLISVANGQVVAQRWLDYQQSHLLKIKMQYIATTQQTSDIVKIILPNNRELVGELVYQSLDVAGGMIANAEIMCSNQLS